MPWPDRCEIREGVMGVSITRSRGETQRSEDLAAQVAGLGAPCVGCSNCRGLCVELIEAMVLPEIILSYKRD